MLKLNFFLGATRPMYPSDSSREEDRKRMNGEHMGVIGGHPCLDREQEPFIR